MAGADYVYWRRRISVSSSRLVVSRVSPFAPLCTPCRVGCTDQHDRAGAERLVQEAANGEVVQDLPQQLPQLPGTWGGGGGRGGGGVCTDGVYVGVRKQTRVSWGHDREGGVGVGMPRSVTWGLISSNTHRNAAHDDLVSEERGHTGKRPSVASVCLCQALSLEDQEQIYGMKQSMTSRERLTELLLMIVQVGRSVC